MINSRDKGKRGELEAAKAWEEIFGVEMRRSQQFCGRSDESDDIIGQPGVSFEVKRVARINVQRIVAKAVEDAAEGRVAVVLHRGDNQPWLVSLQLEDLSDLVATLFQTLADN
jgi:hypothetical protein